MTPMTYVALLLAAMVGITEHWLALPAAAYMGWVLHRLYARWEFRRSIRGHMAMVLGREADRDG